MAGAWKTDVFVKETCETNLTNLHQFTMTPPQLFPPQMMDGADDAKLTT